MLKDTAEDTAEAQMNNFLGLLLNVRAAFRLKW